MAIPDWLWEVVDEGRVEVIEVDEETSELGRVFNWGEKIQPEYSTLTFYTWNCHSFIMLDYDQEKKTSHNIHK